jgi:multimeric flavodoxin WrbA
MKVKILGISGSPRHGNTDILVEEALKAAESLGDVETEFIAICDYKIKSGCISCYRCMKTNDDDLCKGVKGDDVNMLLKKMMEAEGWIIGCPVYWGGITAQLKMLIDRTCPVEFVGYGFRNKVGGIITVAYDRQGGLEGTIADIQRWFLTHDMILVSVGPERPKTGIACYYGVTALQGWPNPVSFSREPKGSLTAVKQDSVGLEACKYLGLRVAEMAKVVKAGFKQVKTKWPYGRVKPQYGEG